MLDIGFFGPAFDVNANVAILPTSSGSSGGGGDAGNNLWWEPIGYDPIAGTWAPEPLNPGGWWNPNVPITHPQITVPSEETSFVAEFKHLETDDESIPPNDFIPVGIVGSPDPIG